MWRQEGHPWGWESLGKSWLRNTKQFSSIRHRIVHRIVHRTVHRILLPTLTPQPGAGAVCASFPVPVEPPSVSVLEILILYDQGRTCQPINLYPSPLDNPSLTLFRALPDEQTPQDLLDLLCPCYLSAWWSLISMCAHSADSLLAPEFCESFAHTNLCPSLKLWHKNLDHSKLCGEFSLWNTAEMQTILPDNSADIAKVFVKTTTFSSQNQGKDLLPDSAHILEAL